MLTAHFGELTAFTRAPAEGLWRSGSEKTSSDDIVVLEVMSEVIDRDWWRAYKRELTARFHQQEIDVRAQEIELL